MPNLRWPAPRSHGDGYEQLYLYAAEADSGIHLPQTCELCGQSFQLDYLYYWVEVDGGLHVVCADCLLELELERRGDEETSG